MPPLDIQIEAVLFHTAEPATFSRLEALFQIERPTLSDALDALATRLEQGAIRLVRTDTTVTLATAPSVSSLIETLTKEQIAKELSKSALETFSIVLYKGPITRSEIDYIRGVNSTFILRNLLVRGLIEKQDNPQDARSPLYAPTMDALTHLGITTLEDLPERERILSEIHAFVEAKDPEPSVPDAELQSNPEEDPDTSDDLEDFEEPFDFEDTQTESEETPAAPQP